MQYKYFPNHIQTCGDSYYSSNHRSGAREKFGRNKREGAQTHRRQAPECLSITSIFRYTDDVPYVAFKQHMGHYFMHRSAIHISQLLCRF